MTEPVQETTAMEQRRAKLAEIVARQDAARGRPLTAREKLENLARALNKPTDYFTRRTFDEPE